jgi:leader peptidase (prepilin peptidase)/N-methyltransferase
MLTASWLALVGGVVGLPIGSFLNVVAYRVPLGRSVIRPRSACPDCGTEIRLVDNVPVLSWLWLRGRCRECGSGISVRYPLVEAGTATIFALLALETGPSWALPAFWWGASVAIALTLTDLEHRRLPNRILLPGIGVGLVLLVAGALADGTPSASLRAAAGGAAYFALLLVVALAARGGFGFGDVKLGALLGMFLAYRSWGVLGVGVFAAFAIGGLVAGVLLLLRRANRKTALPFGPSMVAGAAIALVWGEALAGWYLGS